MMWMIPAFAARSRIRDPLAHRRVRSPRVSRRALCWPRATCRGLGLLDAILAAAVLSVLILWGGQIAGNWVDGRVVAGEARTVTDLARAGRLLVEGDITHAGRRHGVGTAPLSVPLATLQAAGLRAPALGNRSPGRRTLTLWLYRPNAGALLVIARARGDRPVPRLPGAEDGVNGVGVLLAGDTRLRGPGVDFDMAPVNALATGFATTNDLFAFDYVALNVTCHSYLYRQAVDCDGDGTNDPQANTMAVGLDMGGNDLTGVGALTATSATIGTLQGETEITGALTVDGELDVTGATTVEDLTVSGALTATTVETTGTLTVPGLTSTGGITGANLTMTGTVTVSGKARLGDADVDTLSVRTLNVRQLSADRGDVSRIFADDVTTTRCTGCR